MKIFIVAFVLFISGTGVSAKGYSKVLVLEGCQGEGCDCLADFRSAKEKAADAPTIRPFVLYEGMSASSKVIGRFKKGTPGRPLSQKIVVHHRGKYIVERVKGKVADGKGGFADLKAGDSFDTMTSLGEGFVKARKNGRWISFDGEAVDLKTVARTKATGWMEVLVGGIRGYTTDYPFQGCLE